jgi:hypothetical protein
MANRKWEQRAHYILCFKNSEVDTCNTHDPHARTISYFRCEINKNILGAYQCWEVLIFLWQPAGSGSLMMLWEPVWFSNIHPFFGLMSSSQVVTFLVFSYPKPRELWEPDLSSMRETVRFSKKLYLYIWIGSHNRFSVMWEPEVGYHI